MIWLHLVLGLALLGVIAAFIAAQFSYNVSADSCIGLGLFTFLTLLAFVVSFMK